MTEKRKNFKTKEALEISSALLGLAVVSTGGTQVAHAETVKTPVVATANKDAKVSPKATLDITTADKAKEATATNKENTGDTKAYDDAVKYNENSAKDNSAVNQAKADRDKALDTAKQAGAKVTQDPAQKYDSADKAKSDYEAQTSDINKKVADYKEKQEAHNKVQATADTVKDSQEAKDLHDVVSDAQKVDGITVIKDADKVANVDADKVDDAIKSAKQDDKDQVQPIKDVVANQEKEIADYNAKKAEYDKKYQVYVNQLKEMGIWHEGAVDPSTLSQHFHLPNQPYAKVDAELLQNVGTLDKNTMTLTFDDKNGAGAVNGDIMKVTYTNLSGASYDDTPIDKIVLTLSDKEARTPTSWSNVSTLQYHNDPTYGWTYIGYEGLTGTLQFYDDQGKLIDFNNDKAAYMTVSSLNNFDMGNGQTSPEKVQLLSNGEGIILPESSVTVHDGNILYSEKPNNDEDLLNNFGQKIKDKYTGWDNADQPNRIFGSGLFRIEGNSVKIKTYSEGRNSAWFAFSSTLPSTTLDEKAPVKPTATINWHDNIIQVNGNAVAPEIHIHDAEFTSQTANAAKVSVIDDTTHKTLHQEAINGKAGDVVIFPNLANELKDLESKGYKIISNDTQGKKFDSDLAKNVFEVHVAHKTQAVTDSKDITQTIHYVYEDGTTAKPDHVAKVSFTRTGTKDLVTENVTWGAWQSKDNIFKEVVSPTIPGYTPDKKSVPATKASADGGNQVVVVTYKRNATSGSTPDKNVPTPVKPNTKQPQASQPKTQPQKSQTTQVHNAKPIKSNPQHTISDNSTNSKSTHAIATKSTKTLDNVSTPTDNINSAQQPVTAKSDNQQLPQTGNTVNKGAIAAGLASLLGAIGLGFLAHKKRKEQGKQAE